MFKKLRNRLILINLGITTMVIVVTFTMIYVLTTRSASERPPEISSVTITHNGERQGEINTDVEQIVVDSLNTEKQAAAEQLLITLIVSGVMIEIFVALISYYLAEEAIKPVKEAYESQKVFIANASHEIKTPLAAIAANLEAADVHDNRWIANVEKETAKLTTLNNELLNLARTDLVKDVSMEETDLAAAIDEAIKILNPRLKNHNLTKKITMSRKIRINRGDYVQVLNILLDNAIKYADQKIMIFADDHTLTVKNDGATISEKDLPHIFERFYQTDKTSEGVGLGLSIAKATSERNGWTLTAESGKKYTQFTLKF